MVFTEDLSIFFNTDEFGTTAVINGKTITGFFSYGTIVVNDVETRKPIFTCREADIADITSDVMLEIQQRQYRVISIKSDGVGLATLILELK